MTDYIILPLVSFLASVACGVVSIPAIIRFCVRKGLLDLPSVRKVHKSGVPRLGGIAFLPSMLLSCVLAIAYHITTDSSHTLALNLWPVLFFASLLTVYVTGIVDDLFDLGASVKFAAQLVASALLPAGGLYINNLYGFMGLWEIPAWAGMPLTVLVIMYVTNAYNLIDGIDGLSAGLSVISLSGFFACFAREGLYLYCALIAGLLGVLVVYAYFNLFGSAERGTKTFMGDSGSLTLGFIMAVLLVKLTMDNPRVKPFDHNNILFAYTLVIVPVFDVSRVILVRAAHGRSIFAADKNHLHHKLMRASLSPHATLAAMLAMALGFIALNVAACPHCPLTLLVAADVILWIAMDLIINVLIRRNKRDVFVACHKDAG